MIKPNVPKNPNKFRVFSAAGGGCRWRSFREVRAGLRTGEALGSSEEARAAKSGVVGFCVCFEGDLRFQKNGWLYHVNQKAGNSETL